MASSLQSDNSRLHTRLLWCRVVVRIVLSIVGVAFFMLAIIEEQSVWMTFLRTLMASVLLTFAVVENLLRTSAFPPAARGDAQVAATDPGKKPQWLRRLDTHLLYWQPYLIHLGITAVCSFLAICFISGNLSVAGVLRAPAGGFFPALAVLLASCFGLLVCERTLSFHRLKSLPRQVTIIGLLRALLSISVLMTAALGISRISPMLAFWLTWAASLIVFLVALEFLLRTLAALCIAPGEDKVLPFLTQSVIAELYRWPLHPLLMLRKKSVQHLGVDIGKIQAFRLIGRIFLPVTCGVVLVGWLVSGLHEVSPSQRGVYERFGRPVAVLPPGLHLGLPWPFGRVMPVDFGAVHELPLSEIRSQENAGSALIPDTIEGPAPQESWRLWDNTHNTDRAQVIASDMAGKQSFQIVNMDIRLIWRVGLQDQDALNSLYQTDDLPTIVQRIARQVMTQYFAHQQLDNLLNEQRASMSAAMNVEIQKRLDTLHTGVELLYTRVESIHPPAGAANAYHGVQAAQITASTQIAKERGYAAFQSNEARRKATTAVNDAAAAAGERMAQANVALTVYSAEHRAWQINPDAYLNERRYQTYSHALARTPLLIIDRQLAEDNAPMLDLRQFSQPSRLP